MVNGRMLERRQDAAGSWSYVVAVEVPAAAVVPVPGEPYELVPTWRAYVVHTSWFDRPGVLHRSSCASVTSPRGIGVRSLSIAQARELLRAEPETHLCPLCGADPGA